MVKADVLAALDAARGKYISGQELAQQLGVSRTAIWKAVAALRACFGSRRPRVRVSPLRPQEKPPGNV